jgi:mRNA interferase MazF
MIKRGDIYFVKRRTDLSFGSETAKSRPGIIVSNDVLNATSDVVEVVYLTTQPKKNMPTHVDINATGTRSVALCEQIDHVSINLLDNWCGRCTVEEMSVVDQALLCSLGLHVATEKNEPQTETVATDNIDPHALAAKDYVEIFREYTRALAERDTYKELLNKVLRSWGVEE